MRLQFRRGLARLAPLLLVAVATMPAIPGWLMARARSVLRPVVPCAPVVQPAPFRGAVSGTVALHPRADPPMSIPPLASLLGIRVGYDGQDRLERRLGRGRSITGGHPQGAELWNLGRTGWHLHTDGFNYRADSGDRDHVVEEFWLRRGRYPSTPTARLSSRALMLWPGIRLGMTRTDIVSLLRRKGIPFHAAGRSLKLRAEGFVRLNWNDTCTTWTAEYDFAGARLREVYVEAE